MARRLGPVGPPPTIAKLRAQGVTAVRICCEAALDRGICLRCDSAKVRAVPALPDGGKREENIAPRMPGTVREYRVPGLGEAPTGQ